MLCFKGMAKYSLCTFGSKYCRNNKDLHEKMKNTNVEFIVQITAYWAMNFSIFIFPTASLILKTQPKRK